MKSYFEKLTSHRMAELVATAERSVCLAAPGLFEPLAEAIAAKAATLGPELITICVDFDERVFRMGFGTVQAVQRLRASGVEVMSSPGLRMGLLIVDDNGFAFTPSALLLEGEKEGGDGVNAMHLLPAQAKEAMARLSPAAKAVAIVLAKTEDERQALRAIKVETTPAPVVSEDITEVAKAIEAAPLVKFDVARQVRVYNAFLQYVKISLKNASIDRKRVAIPNSLLSLGGTDLLDGRLKATFDLIEKNSSLSSSPITKKVDALRENFTPSVGEGDRVMLKANKTTFEERLATLRGDLAKYQTELEATIDAELNKSKEAIVSYYAPIAEQNPPDVVAGRFGADVRAWIRHELERAFPSAQSLVSKMVLDVDFKDVTYETLQSPKFLKALKNAYPNHNWDKAHEEYQAAGETKPGKSKV